MAANGTSSTTTNELAQMAHLMRRAGFGASRSELDALVAKGYEAVVDDLVNPERLPDVDEDILERYYGGEGYPIFAGIWFFRMLNSQRPLQEKMALFWHHVFATGVTKNQHVMSAVNQIKMFRSVGMTDLRTILLELAKDPAMIFWLDNNENHNGEPNENWGRELLELFSMAWATTRSRISRTHRARSRMDIRAADTAVSARVLPCAVQVHRGRPRRRGEDVPGPVGQSERRGHHRHHRGAAGDGTVHRAAHVQLLRGGRAAGAVVEHGAASGSGRHRHASCGVPAI